MLDQQEKIRYQRHISLAEIGLNGQTKLKAAKVLVIGAGGLGCPVLQYLVAAGIGTIGIVDDDVVDASNLQRQILYRVEDVGKSKAETARQQLLKQNPHIEINAIPSRLTAENALDIIAPYSIVVDGSDNFPTRYLVNDACVMAHKTLVFGSIFKFEGQVSVFNYKEGPTYRCLFPEPPGPGEVPNCSEIGVLGVLPGLIGTMQANEVLKIVLNLGDVLSGKLFMVNALTMQSSILNFRAVPTNRDIRQLMDYEDFCGIVDEPEGISVETLHQWMSENRDLQVIDVRETFETEICKISNSVHIPLGNIVEQSHRIKTDRPVIMVCHHGARSASAIDALKEAGSNAQFLNLEEGIHAWAIRIDNTMTVY